MLKILFPTEVLPIRIFHPTHHNLIVRQAIGVLERLQANHQPGRFRWTTIVGAIQFAKRRIETVPIDQIREPIKLVALIKQVVQAVAKKVR